MTINTRAYGIIIFNKKILVCNEIINNYHATKFPGGGVKYDEKPEDALKREIAEELSLNSNIKFLIHRHGITNYIHPFIFMLKLLEPPKFLRMKI